jgi:hypothetical protein
MRREPVKDAAPGKSLSGSCAGENFPHAKKRKALRAEAVFEQLEAGIRPAYLQLERQNPVIGSPIAWVNRVQPKLARLASPPLPPLSGEETAFTELVPEAFCSGKALITQ